MYYLEDDRYIKFNSLLLLDLKKPFDKKWLQSACKTATSTMYRPPGLVAGIDNAKKILVNPLDGVWFTLPKTRGTSALYRTYKPLDVNRIFWAMKIADMFNNPEAEYFIQKFRLPLDVAIKSLKVKEVFTDSPLIQSIVTRVPCTVLPNTTFHEYELLQSNRYTKIFESIWRGKSHMDLDKVPTLILPYIRFPRVEVPEVKGPVAVVSLNNISWSTLVTESFNFSEPKAFSLSLLM